MMIKLKSAVPFGNDVYSIVFESPTLNHTFVKLIHDTNDIILKLVALGEVEPEIDETQIQWSEPEGRTEIDFYDGKAPVEQYATVNITLDETIHTEIEDWCTARCITAEMLIVAILKFIVQPGNDEWLQGCIHDKGNDKLSTGNMSDVPYIDHCE